MTATVYCPNVVDFDIAYEDINRPLYKCNSCGRVARTNRKHQLPGPTTASHDKTMSGLWGYASRKDTGQVSLKAKRITKAPAQRWRTLPSTGLCRYADDETQVRALAKEAAQQLGTNVGIELWSEDHNHDRLNLGWALVGVEKYDSPAQG